MLSKVFRYRCLRAHLVSTGMGPVYDGIDHLLLTPEDLVPVLALGLYAGLRGVVTGRRAMFILPLAWFVGGIAGSALNIVPAFPIPAMSFLVLGGLIAADLFMPATAVTAYSARLCPWIPERCGSERWSRNARVGRYHDNTFCPCHIAFGLCRLAQKALGACGGARGGQLDRGHRDADVRVGDAMRRTIPACFWPESRKLQGFCQS